MAPETERAAIEHPYVTRRDGVLGGSPIVGDRRIPVWQIAESVRQGYSVEQIIAEYEGRLPPAAVYDAISYYNEHREEIDHEIWLNTSDEALEEQLKELGAFRDRRGAIRFRRPAGRQHAS